MSVPYPLSDDQFRRIVGPSGVHSESARPDERRRFKRFAVRIDLACRGLDQHWEPTGKGTTGVTLNMSQSGILFDTSDEIYANLVLVQFIRSDEVIAERIVRISRRTPDRGAAVIAGEFVKGPADNSV